MGGLLKMLPNAYLFFLIGSLALFGFPFLSGFYSKDFILETFFFVNYKFIYLFLIFIVGLTLIYSLRLLFFVFFGYFNGYKSILKQINEHNIIYITITLSILSIFSIFFGFYFKSFFFNFGLLNFENVFLNKQFLFFQNNQIEFLTIILKQIPLFYLQILLIFFICWFFFFKNFIFFKILKNIKIFKYFFVFYNFLVKKWFFDFLLNNYLILKIQKINFELFFFLIERGVLEIFGPLLFNRIFFKLSLNLKQLKNTISNFFELFFIHYIYLFIYLFFIFNLYYNYTLI
jgi:NADH:ubiquinone oxidoreductase subunit 5 (subunit L)/multisubunit Na+/H+ antiporter MnhA subunit